MTQRDMIAQLRTLRHTHGRINPDPVWVRQNREILLAQIRNTVTTSETAIAPRAGMLDRLSRFVSRGLHLFFPQRILVFGRSAIALLLVFGVTASGWIATVSAANSLPGEPLYQVKLAKEKTELMVASAFGSEEDKVNTLLKHASNRVEEYQKSSNSLQAAQAIQSLKKSIEGAGKSLAEAGSTSGTDATAVAKAVNEKTEQLLQSLEHSTAMNVATGTPSVAPLPELHGPSSGDSVILQKEVGEASHLIAVTGVKAAEVLVEKKLEGDKTVDLNEVKASVEKKLDKLVTDFSQITVVEQATSTAISTTTVGVIKEAVKETEHKVVEANKVVEKTVAEAKTLIGNNDLLGALQKVQELATVKKDTASVVIDARAATESIMATTTAATLNTSTAEAAPPVPDSSH